MTPLPTTPITEAPQRTDTAPRLPSIVQQLVDDVRVVVVASRGARYDGEFDAHVAEAVAMAPSVRAVLVLQMDADAGLDATERKKLFDAGLFNPPTAVLLDGAFGRFVLTAVRWMGAGNVYGFGKHQFDAACDALHVPRGRRSRIAAAIQELSAKLTVPTSAAKPASLELVATANRIRNVVELRVERMRAKSTHRASQI